MEALQSAGLIGAGRDAASGSLVGDAATAEDSGDFGGVARIRDGGGGGDGGAGSDTTEPPLAKALATSEPSDVDRVCRGEGERRGSWEPIVLPRSADNSSSSAACASSRAAGMSRVETLRLGGIAAGP